MAKTSEELRSRQTSRSARAWILLGLAIIAAASVAVFVLLSRPSPDAQREGNRSAPNLGGPLPVDQPRPAGSTPGASSELQTMEVAKAVMVTVQLDYGSKIPKVAEALRDVERRHAPADGTGRTFAILDAYGEPTPDGRLHLSMHVSSEKPGLGSLVFRRTGEILWTARIVPTGTIAQPRNLLISLDDGNGRPYLLDGSGNIITILNARVRDLGIPVRDFWPDGAERELTFVYSACGCPVNVMARRVGERTRRTSELPVIFPDDPDAATTISALMGW